MPDELPSPPLCQQAHHGVLPSIVCAHLRSPSRADLLDKCEFVYVRAGLILHLGTTEDTVSHDQLKPQSVSYPPPPAEPPRRGRPPRSEAIDAQRLPPETWVGTVKQCRGEEI